MTQEELERLLELIETAKRIFNEIWEKIKAGIEALTKAIQPSTFEIQETTKKLGVGSVLFRRNKIAKTTEKCKVMKAKEAYIATRPLFRARSNC